eukprot:RCo024562
MSGPRRYFVLVGNSGVGKSYLLNALQPTKVFEAREDFGSVTTEVEQAEHDGVVYLNIPGLLESDPTNIARNKRELERAMLRRRAEYRIGFVFGLGNGGRIDRQDIIAYQEFCKGFGQSAQELPVILNNAPAPAPGTPSGLQLEKAQRHLREISKGAITAPVTLIFHDDTKEHIRAAVKAVTDSFDWRPVEKVAEMILDMGSEAYKRLEGELKQVQQALEKALQENSGLRKDLDEQRDNVRRAQRDLSDVQHKVQSQTAEMDAMKDRFSRRERELEKEIREVKSAAAAAPAQNPIIVIP